MVHAVVLLLITLFAGRYAARIPMASLAAIQVVVAYHMSEWRVVRSELRGAPRADAAVPLTTFALTVVVDLTVAIAVGMVLAAMLFMKRMANSTQVAAVAAALRDNGEDSDEPSRRARHARVPRDVEVYDVNGPFFFGAAEAFKDALRQVNWRPRALIIDMEGVPVTDSTGLRALAEVIRQSRQEGIRVLLCDLTPGVRDVGPRSDRRTSYRRPSDSQLTTVGFGLGVEVEARDQGPEPRPVVPNELVVSLHKAVRALEDAVALVLMQLARLEPRLLSHHPLAAHLVVFAETDRVVNPPESGNQLRRDLADILDPDRVPEYEMAQRGTRLAGEKRGPDGDPDPFGESVVERRHQGTRSRRRGSSRTIQSPLYMSLT
jgi:anti-anti-sigma factor